MGVHHHLRCLVRLDQERQLEALLGRRAQGRPLERSGLEADVLRWYRELELEGANEGEEECLEPVNRDELRANKSYYQIGRTRRERTGIRYTRGDRR